MDEINLPRYNRFCALVLIAPLVWRTIVFAWLCVAASMIFSFEVPSSGAVLAGLALVSESIYENLRWRKLVGSRDTFYAIELRQDLTSGNSIFYSERRDLGTVVGQLRALLSLAKDDSIQQLTTDRSVAAGQPVKLTHWFVEDTIAQVQKWPSRAIIVTALAGAILWGYGHLIWQ